MKIINLFTTLTIVSVGLLAGCQKETLSKDNLMQNKLSTVTSTSPLFVDLKSASRFGVLGASAITNVGPTQINNLDVGISPGGRTSVTGFPPALISNGALYSSDDVLPLGTGAMLAQAKLDLLNAYNFAESALLPAPVLVAGDQGGKTLTAGIYKSTSTLLIQSGDLTLDAQGDPNAVWIFQIGSALTTIGGAGGNVILTNGALANNVFWQIGSSATIGDYTSFKGNVLAYTSITVNSFAVIEGRLLAENAAVTFASTSTINSPLPYVAVNPVTVPVDVQVVTAYPSFVDLKSAGRFGILGAAAITNVGLSVISGQDVGISPGGRSSVTGFPPALITNGALYGSDDLIPSGTGAMLAQAKLDLAAAYHFAESASLPAPVLIAGEQGGKTLTPGIYKSTSTLLIASGDLTLDAKGDANAIWIFQIGSALTTVGGAGGNVILAGGAQSKNIFWQIGSSATIGDYTSFKGNVLAYTSITMNSNAVTEGRLLAINAAVTLTSTNKINKP